MPPLPVTIQVAPLAMLIIAACASGPGALSAPEVSIVQLSSVANVRVESASGLPVHYQLTISNPFDHPVTLVSVEVESVGQSGAYHMKRVRHVFEEVIPANSSGTIALRAWVQPLQADVSGAVTSPVMIRGSARFEGPDGVMRRNFVGRGQ